MVGSDLHLPNPISSLQQLLFLPQDEEPRGLFLGPSDLASELMRGGDTGYKDVNSVLSSLSHVLKRKRTCKPELSSQILSAVKRRAQFLGLSVSDERLEHIERLLGMPSEAVVSCDRLEFATLLRRIRIADSLVALAPTGVLSTLCGYEVFMTMVQRLQQLAQNPREEQCAFWFLCSNDQAAIEVWRQIALTWQRCLGSENSPDTFAHIRLAASAGWIRVLSVPEESCLFPTLLVNPAKPEACSGFHLEILSEDRVSISQMSQASLHRWQLAVFFKLTHGSFGKVVPFDDLNLQAFAS